MATITTDIHPDAEVHETAELGEGVRVERGAVIGPHCRVGAGSRVMMRAILLEHVEMGRDNVVHPYAVLGGDPQDLKFDREQDPGRLVVGDGNVFREGVTLNRGAGEAGPTTVGDGCYLMANAHAGHNAKVGDRVILANNVNIAGHTIVGDGCFFSGNCQAHQFTRVGRLVMLRGMGGVTMHTPPFVIARDGISKIGGLNIVGLRRAGMSAEEIASIKEVYRLFYRARRAGSATFADALVEADKRQWLPPAQEFVDFIRWALSQKPPFDRGVCPPAE